MFGRILFLWLLIIGISSELSAQKQYGFRVTFTNKDGGGYDLSKPTDFLSSRALDRRMRQSIAIDSNDLPVVQAYIDSVLKVSTGIYHSRSKWQNNCIILVNDTSQIPKLRALSFVQSARYIAVFLSPLHSISAPKMVQNEKKKKINSQLKSTGSIAYYGDAFDQIKLANGDYLHDSGYRGKGKLIAVMDEGFHLVNTLAGFDSLRTSGRIIDHYNFNLNQADVYGYSAHGTQILSTMAGILNGQYVGTAPDAEYALYVTENGSVEQPIEMDNLVAAMERADSVGADIITISLGYNTFDIGGLDASLSLSDIDGKSSIAARGANTATQKGILVVSSAGNEGGSTWKKILTPGDADSVLTCGSVDINKNVAFTSGRGPNASGTRKPDLCMLGAPGIVFNNSGTTSAVGGTSIATPQLAGLAACLWEANPSANPYTLRQAIRQSAHMAASPNNDVGWGVPDFGKASLSLKKNISNDEARQIVLYPNPFKDIINLRLVNNPSDQPIHWKLFSILGQQIAQGQINTTGASTYSIDCSNITTTGTFILQLKIDGTAKAYLMEKR